jgi:hypothetical protein
MANSSVYKLKKILFNCISILIVTMSLAIATTPFEMPDLGTDEKKLEWLLKVKKEVPDLFADAANYDINLFKLLGDQARLQKELAKNPKYQIAMEKMHQEYLSISIAPKSEQKVKAYIISPEAVADWKKNLKSTLSNLGDRDLNTEITALVQSLGTKSSKGLATGLVMGLPPEERKRILALPATEKMEALKEKLPSVIGKEFKAQNFGFSQAPSKDEVLNLLKKLETDEKHLNDLLELHIVLQNPEGVIKNSSAVVIDALDDHALSLFTEGDAINIKLKTLNLANVKDLAQTIKKHFNHFAQEQDVIEEKIGQAIKLSEMPPAMGIFRGCTGGDCSTQFSFPYPNSPNEKVFYVYNHQNEIKGYITGNIVLADGKPSFQILTIAGPRISSADTEMIVQGLYSAKEKLGVSQIVLPSSANLNGLINYSSIKKVLENKVLGKATVIQTYLDRDFRDGIEDFKSTYNSGDYDKMERNNRVVIFVPTNDLSLKVDVDFKDSSKLTSAIVNQKNAVLEFAFDLMSSNRMQQMEQVLTAAHFSPEMQKDLTENLINQRVLSISEYKEKVKKWFNYTDAEFAAKKDYFMPGLSNAKDSISLAEDSDYLVYLEKIIKKYPQKKFKNYSNPQILKNLIERGRSDVLGYLTIHFFATEQGDQYPELFKKLIDKNDQESMNALAYFAFNKQKTEVQNNLFEYFIKHANDESLTMLARMCPKFKASPYTEQWHALIKKHLENAGQKELYEFSKRSYPLIKSPESSDLVSLLIKNGSQQVWRNIANVPLSLELREQNILLINTKDPDTLKLILASTFSNPEGAAMEEELILIIQNSTSEVRTMLSAHIFSRPYTQNMKLSLKALIEKSNLHDLEFLARFTFSKPHTENMSDLIELLIEKSKNDESVGTAMARYVFSEPHTKGMENLLLKLISCANSETMQAIAHDAFSKPHSADMHAALSLLIENADEKTLVILDKEILVRPPWTEKKNEHFVKQVKEKHRAFNIVAKDNKSFCSNLYSSFFEKIFH